MKIIFSQYAGTKLCQQRFYDLPQSVGYGHVDAGCPSPAAYCRVERQSERRLLHRFVGGGIRPDDLGNEETSQDASNVEPRRVCRCAW